MREKMLKQVLLFGILLILPSLVGCQNTAEGVVEDTSKNTKAVAATTREAGEKAREDAKKTGEAVKEGAESAGAAVVTGVKKTGQAAETLGIRSEDLTRVNAALAANAKLKSSKINVDTLADGSGVVLKGKVMTNEDKVYAEHIAKETLPKGKTVTNEITVGE